MSMIKCFSAATLFVGILTTCALADDWPQWRGLHRDDNSGETDLLHAWPKSGPDRLWLFDDAGGGYLGFSISRGQLFTMGTRDGATVLLSLDANSGKELWVTKLGEVLTNGWAMGREALPLLTAIASTQCQAKAI